MKAITTKYHGPTDRRGARISASDEDGNRVSIPYPSENTTEDCHKRAALALCKKIGWDGGESLIGGGVKGGGYVWVFSPYFHTQLYHAAKRVLELVDSGERLAAEDHKSEINWLRVAVDGVKAERGI